MLRLYLLYQSRGQFETVVRYAHSTTTSLTRFPSSPPEKRQIPIEICRFSVMIALRQVISYEMLRIVIIGFAKF